MKSKALIVLISVIIGICLNAATSYLTTDEFCTGGDSVMGSWGIADFFPRPCFGWPLETDVANDSGNMMALKWLANLGFWSVVAYLLIRSKKFYEKIKNRI